MATHSLVFAYMVQGAPPDFWQVWQWRIAVFGGLMTAVLGVSGAYAALQQRRIEHRWKQAQLGKTILDELFADPFARDACYMLDVERRRYPALAGDDKVVTREDVLVALRLAEQRAERRTSRLPLADLGEKHVFICDCFDVLFYRLNRLEHFIETGLVRFDDVITPLEYYAECIRPDRDVFTSHMRAFQHERAVKLLRRYWDPPPPRGYWRRWLTS